MTNPAGAFYNENDPYAAQWLRNLIAAGEIAPGVVDDRSVADVRPADLEGFAQVHLFAGIGVWSRALRDAGWPDGRPVWTGSCPCQPFSSAGRGGGFDDARHLWPHYHRLVRAHRPVVVLGEQVASKDGLEWLDAVFADLEGEGYACGAVDTCAAGHGAPHIRQRLWWVGLGDAGSVGRQGRQPLPRPATRGVDVGAGADGGLGVAGFEGLEGHHRHGDHRGEPGRLAADQARPAAATGGSGGLAEPGDERRQGERLRLQPRQPRPAGAEAGRGVEAGGLADAELQRAERRDQDEGGSSDPRSRPAGELLPAARAGGEPLGLADAADQRGPQVTEGDDPLDRQRPPLGRGAVEPAGAGADRRASDGDRRAGRGEVGPAGEVAGMDRPGPADGFWRDADWLLCRDGRWRPVEPGTFPLAHGAPARVGRLRAYGNAIVLPQAAAFASAVLDITGGPDA